MRRGSLLGLATIVAALWSGGCEGEESKVNEGMSGSGGNAGSAGSLSLGAMGNAAGAPAGGAGGAEAEPPGPEIEECDFSELMGCSMTSVEASYSAANVLLVIDKSGSMDDQPTGFDVNKWDALKAALEPALAEVSEEMSFGLLLYPFQEDEEIPLDCLDNCCEVPTGAAAIRVGIGPGTETASAVMDALNDTSPGGGTPTAHALEAALEYFKTGDGKDLQGDRFVLLATDGGPNCGPTDSTCDADRCTPNLDGVCPADEGNCCEGEGEYCLDDAAVIEQIEALAELGVPTFVIGIPGTEQYASYLDTFATAGTVPNSDGPPEYFAVSAEGGVEALTQTFVDITTHLVRDCEFDVDTNVVNKMLVNVAVDCDFVPFEAGTGWDIDLEQGVVTLGEEVCDRVKTEGARRVDVVVGCEQVK
jgi:hypothetical protein